MGNQSLRSCLPHVLSLISPAMAPALRPVRRPNMSDSPAQKLPVTHSRVHSPQQLAFSILTCYSHRSTAQVRQEGSDAHKLISLSHPFTIEARFFSKTKSSQLLLDNGWALVEMGVLARSASNYHFLPFRRPPPRLDWPPAGERGSPSADRSSLLVGLLPSPATGCITHLVISINNILIIIIICITFCTVVVSHPMPCNLNNLPKRL